MIAWRPVRISRADVAAESGMVGLRYQMERWPVTRDRTDAKGTFFVLMHSKPCPERSAPIA
jgi:hypothetical protein